MSVSPIVNGSVIDTNQATINLTGDRNKLIRYHSTALAQMVAEASSGATINLDACAITCGGKTKYGEDATFENVDSNEFRFYAEDDKGRGARAYKKVSMVDYIKLTCNIYGNKPNTSGKMTIMCSGNCFIGSFGAQSNSIAVWYKYRISGGAWSGWTSMSISFSTGSYTATADLTGLDYTASYDFECMAIDKLMTVNASKSNVKSVPVFHWGENNVTFEKQILVNNGIAIGSDNSIGSIPTSINKKGGIIIAANNGEGKIELNGVISHGFQERHLTECGMWTPRLDKCSFTSINRCGWYSKAGDIVTVGFYIKLTGAHSEYGNQPIQILASSEEGLPYTASVAAAGGGMCSGAYVSAGFNFQCFVMETSGIITTRVQACNNTSSGNLSTSASGCFCPNVNDLTLSGTITYMTN